MADTRENPAGTGRVTTRVDTAGGVVIVGIWLWIFTIGYLHLGFFQAVLAIVIWPYDLGAAWSALHH